jgi:guanylate kinase
VRTGEHASAARHDGRRLIVVCGPPGTGKTTIVERTLRAATYATRPLVVTTRTSRPGEHATGQYEYVNDSRFDDMARHGRVLASVTSNGGFRYALTTSALAAVPDSQVALVELHPEHIHQLVGLQLTTVLILPPDTDALQERLIGRATESADQRASRLESGRALLSYTDSFEFIIVNEALAAAVRELEAIIMVEWIRKQRASRKAVARELIRSI